MRILSGKYKGRVIEMPQGIRPTQDKVRKALFDIFKDCMEGSKFLDLFAGSGVMGIEALSRGAAFALFVEADGQQSRVLKENLDSLGIREALVLTQDVYRAIENLSKQNKIFDIIYIDPPYYKDKGPSQGYVSTDSVSACSAPEPLSKKTLQILSDYDILAAKGLIVVEHFKRDQLPETVGKLVLWRISKYGDTLLSFYQKKDA